MLLRVSAIRTRSGFIEIVTDPNTSVAFVPTRESHGMRAPPEDTAARLVACFNACADIKHPEHIPAALEALEHTASSEHHPACAHEMHKQGIPRCSCHVGKAKDALRLLKGVL